MPYWICQNRDCGLTALCDATECSVETQTCRCGGLLFCGSYLLADAILQPLDAGTFSVVGGGVFLALRTVLLFYLAWPGKGRSISRRERTRERPLVIPLNGYGEAQQSSVQNSWVTEKKEGLLRPM